jgi:hypothetical protein
MRKSSNLVFIHHPNYFKEENLKGKIGLIYIFNSKQLYNKLSQKYKCVNLGVDGNITDENFFPKRKMNKQIYISVFKFKKEIYAYLKEIFYKLKLKYRYSGTFKDEDFRGVNETADKYFEQNGVMSAIQYINAENLKLLIQIMKITRNRRFFESNRVLIGIVFSYIHSFYKAFVYSFSIKKLGVEAFNEKLKYDLSLAIFRNCLFTKNDLYGDGFDYRYLKILSNSFIEHIDKNDSKNYIQKAILESKSKIVT